MNSRRPSVQVWALDEKGRVLDDLRFHELHATRIANDIGEWQIKLHPRYDRALLRAAHMAQIMYAPPGQVYKPRGLYFFERGDDALAKTEKTLTVGGKHINVVTKWRLYGPLGSWSSTTLIKGPIFGSSNFGVQGYLDDVAKHFARWTIDDSANYGAEYRSLRGQYRFQVDPDLGQGFRYDYEAKKTHLFNILGDLVKLAVNPPPSQNFVAPTAVQRLTGLTVPFRLYWSVDQAGVGADFAMRFRTHVGQLGQDRASASANPLVLSTRTCTLESSQLVWDFTDSINHVYIDSYPDGVDVLQPYIQDITGWGQKWVRKEDIHSPGAFPIIVGLSLVANEPGIAMDEVAYQYMREKRGLRRVQGVTAMHGPLTPGVDFDWGDRVVIEHTEEGGSPNFSDVHLDADELLANNEQVMIRYTMNYADLPRRLRRGGTTTTEFGEVF